MSRAKRERRVDALEVECGRPRDAQSDRDAWAKVLAELSDGALENVSKLLESVVAAIGAAEDEELPLTTDQEIEFQVILTTDAPDPATLARWKNLLGITAPGDEEIDQEIDRQVRKLIADRAALPTRVTP